MGVTETNPLLNRAVKANTRKRKKRNSMLMCIAIAVVLAVVGLMVSIKRSTNVSFFAQTSSVVSKAKIAKSLIRIDPETGVYSVDYDDAPTKIEPKTTTFAELGEIMLLPWYEASLIAITKDDAWTMNKNPYGIDPSDVKNVRRVMLIARDMLDVFSPLFPNQSGSSDASAKDKSLWKQLRVSYRHGYQLLGDLKDLEDLTYSQELLKSRIDDVNEWKTSFIAFQKKHRIRHFLYSPLEQGGGIDPNGCYDHKASHLFWADFENVPCGNDIGMESLKSLATVQLTNALNYLRTIRSYTTVLPEEHEIEFHNLRKELRIFLDEYNLFGPVIVPEGVASWTASTSDHVDTIAGTDATNNNETDANELEATDVLATQLDTMNKAQKMLGHINDKWTAHEIYIEDDSHKSKQETLAVEIDEDWAKFLIWEKEKDLEGCIINVTNMMA